MTIENSSKGPLLRAGTREQAPTRAILEQAGNYCAFPGCEHRSYLDVAHIRAVSAGGPRYDPARPTGPGTANLILLCASHHRLVDAEPHRYSADFLQKLRADGCCQSNANRSPHDASRSLTATFSRQASATPPVRRSVAPGRFVDR
ncbi:HNH endonuclease [Sphingomonas phyllosphaerae]|uniref:HNH endonuclease n=1 Tax=Sphingomonas phyllosphaerae TaxID=257003 RepID=UPI003FA71FD5